MADPRAAGDAAGTRQAPPGGARRALWNTKPEDRFLPSVGGMVPHPGAHEDEGLDRAAAADDEAGGAGSWPATLGVLVVVASLVGAGLVLRQRVVEDRRKTHAAGLVQRLLDAYVPEVPTIIAAMKDYRHWVDPDSETAIAAVAGRLASETQCQPGPSSRQ